MISTQSPSLSFLAPRRLFRHSISLKPHLNLITMMNIQKDQKIKQKRKFDRTINNYKVNKTIGQIKPNLNNIIINNYSQVKQIEKKQDFYKGLTLQQYFRLSQQKQRKIRFKYNFKTDNDKSTKINTNIRKLSNNKKSDEEIKQISQIRVSNETIKQTCQSIQSLLQQSFVLKNESWNIRNRIKKQSNSSTQAKKVYIKIIGKNDIKIQGQDNSEQRRKNGRNDKKFSGFCMKKNVLKKQGNDRLNLMKTNNFQGRQKILTQKKHKKMKTQIVQRNLKGIQFNILNK